MRNGAIDEGCFRRWLLPHGATAGRCVGQAVPGARSRTRPGTSSDDEQHFRAAVVRPPKRTPGAAHLPMNRKPAPTSSNAMNSHSTIMVTGEACAFLVAIDKNRLRMRHDRNSREENKIFSGYLLKPSLNEQIARMDLWNPKSVIHDRRARDDFSGLMKFLTPHPDSSDCTIRHPQL